MTTLIDSIESRIGWPSMIGVGLVGVLLAALGAPALALTGVALVALGAGGCLAQRVAPARRGDFLLLHAVTYSTLYALFLGARVHAAGATPMLVADAAVSLLALAALGVIVVRAVTRP